MGSLSVRCRSYLLAHCALIILLLMVVSPVAAKIVFSRKVTYSVSIEPQVLVLEKTEEFRPENPLGKSSIVIVPDRKVQINNAYDKEALDTLGRYAELISGTYPRQSRTGNLSPFLAASVRAFEEGANRIPPGMKLEITARFENNPSLSARLALEGYTVVSSKEVTPPGQGRIVFRLWATKDKSGSVKQGTARARFNLVNRATVDPRSTVVRGNFSVKQDSKVELIEVSEFSAARKIAKRRFENFSKLVNSELKAVLATLNGSSQRLTPAELAMIARTATGTEVRFERTIPIRWFGDPRDINLVIVARPGPPQFGNSLTSDSNFTGGQ